MIFYLIMPGLYGGFGNYFAMITLGAPEIVYPRINNVSLIILFVSFVVAAYSYVGDFTGGCGWTLYPPLASNVGISAILIGLLISGFSSVITSINFYISILYMRLIGLELKVKSVYAWSILITAVLLLMCLPILTAAIVLILIDSIYNTAFYEPTLGGDPVLYQHLFWFFGHPEVYILILPGFGLTTLAISYTMQTVVFGNQSMILAMTCIAVLGSYVWAHHMYTAAMDSETLCYFSLTTVFIAIPTGTKIFNWICSFAGSRTNNVNAVTFLTNAFLILFTLGGVTGVILGNAGIDVALHDTYYVVAHFHFVLSLGAVLSGIIGLMLFAPRSLGTKESVFTVVNLLGNIWILLAFLLVFVPQHFLGFTTFVRRVTDMPLGITHWNFISSIGSFMSIFAILFIGDTR